MTETTWKVFRNTVSQCGVWSSSRAGAHIWRQIVHNAAVRGLIPYSGTLNLRVFPTASKSHLIPSKKGTFWSIPLEKSKIQTNFLNFAKLFLRSIEEACSFSEKELMSYGGDGDTFAE